MRPVAHCVQTLVDHARQDSRIWLLDGDLADSYGADLFGREHPERFLMAGIAEQGMVSTAAGMAACGLRPWVFSFAAFLCFRAYDQIRVGLAQTGMPVTLVGSHSGGCGGPNGKTHQALNDIAVMASLPNVDVWAPGSDRDTQFVMQEIIKAARPAYIRYPRESWGELPGTAAACRWIGARRRFALVSCGFFTQIALQAAMHLRDGGIDIGVIHLTRLAPFPAIELAAALTNVESLWVAEDHAHFGGLADLIRSNGFSVEEPVFGWPANWAGGVGPASELLRQHALTPDLIADRIAKKLSKGN